MDFRFPLAGARAAAFALPKRALRYHRDSNSMDRILWLPALTCAVALAANSAWADTGDLAASSATEQHSVPVRDVENPDLFPYFEVASASIAPPFVNNFINFPTPPGQRYFIEQATVTCTTPSSTDVFTQALLSVTKIISPTSTQGFSSPVVVLENRGPSFFGGFIWTGSAQIMLITDPNPFNADGSGALFFNVFHTDSSVTANCSATLFGHSVTP